MSASVFVLRKHANTTRTHEWAQWAVSGDRIERVRWPVISHPPQSMHHMRTPREAWNYNRACVKWSSKIFWMSGTNSSSLFCDDICFILQFGESGIHDTHTIHAHMSVCWLDKSFCQLKRDYDSVSFVLKQKRWQEFSGGLNVRFDPATNNEGYSKHQLLF